ncbi:MAG: hypothetical protein ACE5E6_03465 [Phycisphaerae bacterium]
MSMTVHTPTYERVDDRGRLVEVLSEGAWQAILYGSMNAGAVLGNHYHKETTIYFHVIKGCAHIDIVGVASGARRSLTVRAGEGTYLNVNDAHAIHFPEPSECLMARSRRFDPTAPDTYPFQVRPRDVQHP